ncbi:helix-turn-helix domain-containing protein [Bradyrhizobium sp. 13971]
MPSSSPPPAPSAVFPDRLKSARDLRGLNQDQLAKRSGLQGSAISHFETGTRKPSFDNLRRLADALGVHDRLPPRPVRGSGRLRRTE